jgi:hypothetical protein
MKNKMMRLGLGTMVALAFAALPAVASAGEPEIHCGGAVCGKFTSTSGPTSLSTTSGTTVNCASSKGTGEYTTKTTGNMQLTFHECKTPTFFNTACTTPGQPSGTIVTANSVFHNIYESTDKSTPGVLITSPTGGVPYTTFTCAGFLHVEVTGNIIGDLEFPACGASSKEFKLDFVATAHGQQKYKQVTTTGPIWDLDSIVNSGAPVTSAMNGTGIVKFNSGLAGTVTCV